MLPILRHRQNVSVACLQIFCDCYGAINLRSVVQLSNKSPAPTRGNVVLQATEAIRSYATLGLLLQEQHHGLLCWFMHLVVALPCSIYFGHGYLSSNTSLTPNARLRVTHETKPTKYVTESHERAIDASMSVVIMWRLILKIQRQCPWKVHLTWHSTIALHISEPSQCPTLQ